MCLPFMKMLLFLIDVFVCVPRLGMCVDDTVPHEMPASYVKEIREDKSPNKGEKA